jgi:hypothetical protein
LYLLDYPLTPEQHEILKKAYDEITKNWLAPSFTIPGAKKLT